MSTQHGLTLLQQCKHHYTFIALAAEAIADFVFSLPMTIIIKGATTRAWEKSKQRIQLGKSFRDFMLTGKDLAVK
ncbi:MAG: hypothetical protein GJ680_14670 [Alteromonadaceae bacterium]|nr:hypothetical protein [Alteromonadaceae bacterium]